MNIKRFNRLIPVVFIVISCYCSSAQYTLEKDNYMSKSVQLSNDQIKDLNANFDSIAISNISFLDLQEARKSLNYEERKENYIRLLGKKVKWSGALFNFS